MFGLQIYAEKLSRFLKKGIVRMKKYYLKSILSCVLALLLIFSLLAQTGCKTNDNGAESSTPAETPLETPMDTPVETPTETPTETPSETPAETDPFEEYAITYELDGGIDGGNPTSYNSGDAFSLNTPVRVGYDFIGWTGGGYDEPSLLVKIEKGSEGALSFKANWKENGEPIEPNKFDTTNIGKDNGLGVNAQGDRFSLADDTGDRGEGIFTLKTVYTDITVDGIMDPAYTYGVYLRSDVHTGGTFYNGKDTGFEVYMIRGQDGRLYVYAKVTDRDLVVNSHIFNTDGAWRVDSIDMYVELGNYGASTTLYSFVPDKDGVLKRNMPKDTKITITDYGYTVEFAIDNSGIPFFEGDEVGFGFYLNDAVQWNEENKTYTKYLMKNSSKLAPAGRGYKDPSAAINDAVRMALLTK